MMEEERKYSAFIINFIDTLSGPCIQKRDKRRCFPEKESNGEATNTACYDACIFVLSSLSPCDFSSGRRWTG
jgi:hypothetical protein